eukprot:SAG25_NODE_5927_length_605_cov_0.579051_2_plen_140_part_00
METPGQILRRWAREHFADAACGGGSTRSASAAVMRTAGDGRTSSTSSSGAPGESEEEEGEEEKEEGKGEGEGEPRGEVTPLSKRVMIFTSNVDIAFERAGFAEEGVHMYEVHGNITAWQCCLGGRCYGGSSISGSWEFP